MRKIVVGISGATCSGKTLIASLLSKAFGLRSSHGQSTFLFNQDNFYHPEDYPGHVYIPSVDHINWELASAFDNDKLLQAVTSQMESTGNCSVHGKKPGRVDKLFAETLGAGDLISGGGLSRSAVKRFDRLLQKYESPFTVVFVEGITVFGHERLERLCDVKLFLTLDYETCRARREERVYDPPDKPGYFDAVAWPAYKKTVELLQQNNRGICFIDGRRSVEENFADACQAVAHELLREQ